MYHTPGNKNLGCMIASVALRVLFYTHSNVQGTKLAKFLRWPLLMDLVPPAEITVKVKFFLRLAKHHAMNMLLNISCLMLSGVFRFRI